MTQQAPYGTWPSAVTPELITSRTVHLSQLRIDGADTYWVERRSNRGGRQVLLRRGSDGSIGEILPPTPSGSLVDVRSRVHEYGGKAYAVKNGVIVVCDGNDGRVYRFDLKRRIAGLVPLTGYGDMRHGDLEIDAARGLVYAVREDHRGAETVNTLVAIPLDGSAARDDSKVKTIFADADFVAAPTPSPDGEHLAWITWNSPYMPWAYSTLHVGNLNEDGTIGIQRTLADEEGVSVSEPRWADNVDLCFISNKSGYRNLYRTEGFPPLGVHGDDWADHLRVRALHPMEATFSRPAWELGLHSYDVLDGEHLIASWASNAVWHLGTVKLSNGELEEWHTGWQPVGNVASDGGRVVALAATETNVPSIIEVVDGKVTVLRSSGASEPDLHSIAFATPLTWPTSDDQVAHGFFYHPDNVVESEEGTSELPPLIVNVHGGPTSAADPTYNLGVQYWTSRGFAYLDVNYRGSSGFSTTYRKAIYGRWGEVDVADVISGAKYLVERGLVDPARIAVRGASAGGFTALNAAVHSDVFSAVCTRYAIADLKLLAQSKMPKFEAHYVQTLIGYKDLDDPVVAQRSPINHVDEINAPLLLLQGSSDPIVPVNQAESMFDAVDAQGLPVALEIFRGEEHGFRLAQNITKALEAELSFYCQVWGIHREEKLYSPAILNLK